VRLSELSRFSRACCPVGLPTYGSHYPSFNCGAACMLRQDAAMDEADITGCYLLTNLTNAGAAQIIARIGCCGPPQPPILAIPIGD